MVQSASIEEGLSKEQQPVSFPVSSCLMLIVLGCKTVLKPQNTIPFFHIPNSLGTLDNRDRMPLLLFVMTEVTLSKLI